ncbi:outer membrane beta-barrel protein [Sulfurimonas sp.]|uniref:outer membrane beta-barrel protein n=1 Tax=Sulfurimonas sp. TaxID=2022749 RepID=UPI002AB2C992|nr:outer membrane beta-barrel protein [Sulfurimonas sp.]
MYKIIISIAILSISFTVAHANWIGALKPDKKVGSVSLSVGQVTIESETNPLYSLDFGGNYYYDNGILLGATFGLGYTENPNSLIDNKNIFELNGKFKLGYSFGKMARGLALYGLTDFSYLMYNRLDSHLKDKTSSAQGIGFGGAIEYRFSNDWLLSASYTTTNMTHDSGANFDYNKALFGVGYTF